MLKNSQENFIQKPVILVQKNPFKLNDRKNCVFGNL